MPRARLAIGAAVLLGWAAAVLGDGLPARDAVRPPPNKQGDFAWRLPSGFPEPVVPTDNPMSAPKVLLGAELFRDPRLSVTGDYSCESCHSPRRAFTDGRALARGATGASIPLNTPTLVNVAYNPALGWRAPGTTTLEAQMRGPLFNDHPPELGLAGREAVVEAALRSDARMAARFATAFPGDASPVSMVNVIRAIAAFQRTLISGNSAFDRYVFGGDSAALTGRQKQGMKLFFSAATGCAGCHSGINFSGPWRDREHPDVAGVYADNGTGEVVRVPTLRNVARTAPYMHDGRYATLGAVIDHYEREATRTDSRLARPPLTTRDHEALRDFLLALSDDT